MIKISQKEAMLIRENLRAVPIVIVNRQGKSRKKKYYVEETNYVRRFLDRIHRKDIVEHFE